MTRDTTPTDRRAYEKPEIGDDWAQAWDELVEDLDSASLYVDSTENTSASDPIPGTTHFEDVDAGSVNAKQAGITQQPNSVEHAPRVQDLQQPVSTIHMDAAWTWFSGPRATYHGSKTYVGGVNRSGDILIASVDHQTGRTNTTTLHAGLDPNDHANPAILVRQSDGRIIAAYAAHQDSAIRYKISTDPEDISSFGAEQTLSPSGSTCSYAQICELPDEGSMYLFYRDEGSSQNLSFYRSTDGGASWSGPTVLLKPPNGREYWRIGPNGSDRIDIGLTHSEGGGTEPKNDIKHIYIEGGAVYSSNGSKLANLSDPDPLITHSDATMIYDSSATGNTDVWVHDCASYDGRPAIVYAELHSVDDHDWRYATWDGSSWIDSPLVDAGGGIASSAEGHYSAGACLDPANEGAVYIASGDGTSSAILAAETYDEGDSWQTRQISSRNRQNVRPVVPSNVDGAHPTVPVVWMHGYYHGFTGGNGGFQTAVTASTPAKHNPVSHYVLSSSQPISTESKVEFSTMSGRDDRCGYIDESTYSWVVPEDAEFHISTAARINSLSAAGGPMIRLERNGDDFVVLEQQHGDADDGVSVGGGVTEGLKEGDEITVLLDPNTGSSETLSQAGHVTYLRVARVGL